MPGVRTVLVTGVSGHVAGAMADRLAAGGLRVRAMVRTPDQARMAARRVWRPVTGDLAAPGSLGAVVGGADLVVHAAAYLGQDKDMAEAVNVMGTRRLAQAVIDAGAAPFVHISTMSVHRARADVHRARPGPGREPVPYREDPHRTRVPPAADLRRDRRGVGRPDPLAPRPSVMMTAVASAGPGHRAPGVSGLVRACLARLRSGGRVWRWPRCY